MYAIDLFYRKRITLFVFIKTRRIEVPNDNPDRLAKRVCGCKVDGASSNCTVIYPVNFK